MYRMVHSFLHESARVNGVVTHYDLLNPVPTALSQKRAERLGKPNQTPNEDRPGGAEDCNLCSPANPRYSLVTLDDTPREYVLGGNVARFLNSAPYDPYDQMVLHLYDANPAVMRTRLHRVKLEDVGREELYFLTKAAFERGKEWAQTPVKTNDNPRMVGGFNFGKLAGQTVPHVHIQYGWDLPLNLPVVTDNMLACYYDELENEQLILSSTPNLKVISPWTPKGQYQIDLHFGKRELRHMDEDDLRAFAWLGERILKFYVRQLGIQNVNVIFENSPLHKDTLPVVAKFIPRVNVYAQYEMLGVNVVDTPPEHTAGAFRGIRWRDEMKNALNREKFDPEAEIRALKTLPAAK